jgi:arylsulfatase A-like enzyme
MRKIREAIRSARFVYYPTLVPLPRADAHFVLSIDLGPTFAELAGTGVPIAHDGVCFLGVLDGTAPA